jgi:hypothetical protein
MRDDQRVRLKELGEKLIDVFLVEADPDEWAGAGTAPSDRDKQTRGDRAWMLKSVNALASVVRHTMAIEGEQEKRAPADAESVERHEDRLDKIISDAEARAEARIAAVGAIKHAQR